MHDTSLGLGLYQSVHRSIKEQTLQTSLALAWRYSQLNTEWMRLKLSQNNVKAYPLRLHCKDLLNVWTVLCRHVCP